MRYPIKSIGAAAAAAVVTVILSGAPAVAWPGLAKPPIAGNKTIPVADTQPSGRGPEARIQGRINQLHERLRITAAQEDKFKALADVMTANAQSMGSLLQERMQDNDTSAEASLNWYSRLVDAHSQSLKKFIPAFNDLYASLSDDQKRMADRMFAQFGQRPMRGMRGRGRRGR